MSQLNPYTPSAVTAADSVDIRRVKIRPIDLMKRAYRLVGEQYWLFLGISFVGMLIGSAVPFGLILGPMLVGIYLCYLECERGEQVKFTMLFRGFDHFKESFVTTLFLLAATFVVIIPLMIAMFAIVFLPMLDQMNQGNDPPASPQIPAAMFVLYPLMLVANVVIAMPFLFAFQLIADRELAALDAVKTSVRAVWKNFDGVVWYMIVLVAVTFALACMCYVPAFLFMPISFGSLFVLYRDIFPANVTLDA